MILFPSYHNQLVYAGKLFYFVRLQYHTVGAFTLSTYFFFIERLDFIVYILFYPQGVWVRQLSRPGFSLEPADRIWSLHRCRCRCYDKETSGNGSIWDHHAFSNWSFSQGFTWACINTWYKLLLSVLFPVLLYKFTADWSDCFCGA